MNSKDRSLNSLPKALVLGMLLFLLLSPSAKALIFLETCDTPIDDWELWLDSNDLPLEATVLQHFSSTIDDPLFEVLECGSIQAGSGSLYTCDGIEVCTFWDTDPDLPICEDLGVLFAQGESNTYSIYTSCVFTEVVTTCQNIPLLVSSGELQGESVAGAAENGTISQGVQGPSIVEYYIPSQGFVGEEILQLTGYSYDVDGPIYLKELTVEVVDCDCETAQNFSFFQENGLLNFESVLFEFQFDGDFYYQVSDCYQSGPDIIYDCQGNIVCSFSNWNPEGECACEDVPLAQWPNGYEIGSNCSGFYFDETVCSGESVEMFPPFGEIFIFQEPEHGTVEGENWGSIIYTADPFFEGNDYFFGESPMNTINGLYYSIYIDAYIIVEDCSTVCESPGDLLALIAQVGDDKMIKEWLIDGEYFYEVWSCPEAAFSRELYDCEGNIVCNFSNDPDVLDCSDVGFPSNGTSFELVHQGCLTDCSNPIGNDIEFLLNSVSNNFAVNVVEYLFFGEYYYLIQECGVWNIDQWRLVNCQGFDVCAYSQENSLGLDVCADINFLLTLDGWTIYQTCNIGNSLTFCLNESLEIPFDIIAPNFLDLLDDGNGQFEVATIQGDPYVISANPLMEGEYYFQGIADHYIDLNVPYQETVDVQIYVADCPESCETPANPQDIVNATLLETGNVYEYLVNGNYFYTVNVCGDISNPFEVYDCNAELYCVYDNGTGENSCETLNLILDDPALVYSNCVQYLNYNTCEEQVQIELPWPGFEFAWFPINYPQHGVVEEELDPFIASNLIHYQPDETFMGIDSIVFGNWSPIAGEPTGVYGSYLVVYIESEDCLDCAGVNGGTAVIDLCGICLEPTNPDFNACVSEQSHFVCNKTSLDIFYPDAVSGPNAPFGISQEPLHGIATAIPLEGGGYQINYTPSTEYVGTDIITVTQYAFLPSVAWIDIIYIDVYDCGSFEVWPGDINYDGIANNQDIIYFGMEFGEVGPLRPNATAEWIGQVAPNWEQILPNGINAKHSDCDGNGIINLLDKEVILLNYNSEHEIGKGGFDENDPPLYLEMPSTVDPGQLVEVPIFLGSEEIPAPEIYGLAFSLEYNPEYVVPGSVQMKFDQSVFGIPEIEQTHLSFTIEDLGRTEVGLTKIDKMNWSGSGQIGTMSYVMADDIIGKSAIPFGISILDVFALNLADEEVPINPVSDETEVQTGLQENEALAINVFPNPAKDILYLNLAEVSSSLKWTLLDLQGKVVMEDVLLNAKQAEISLINQVAGLYLLQINTEQGQHTQKIHIAR